MKDQFEKLIKLKTRQIEGQNKQNELKIKFKKYVRILPYVDHKEFNNFQSLCGR